MQVLSIIQVIIIIITITIYLIIIIITKAGLSNTVSSVWWLTKCIEPIKSCKGARFGKKQQQKKHVESNV